MELIRYILPYYTPEELNVGNKVGTTAAMYAAAYNHVDALELLVKHGADLALRKEVKAVFLCTLHGAW